MRRFVPPFALALILGAAAAGAAPAPQLTLVEVYETGQALVYDRAAGEYALLRPGSEIQGYRVEALSSDQLELAKESEPGRRYIVTRPAPKTPTQVAAAPAAPAPAATAPTASAATAPAASAAPPTNAPLDPYAEAPAPNQPVKVTRAPAPEQPYKTAKAPTHEDAGAPVDPYAGAEKTADASGAADSSLDEGDALFDGDHGSDTATGAPAAASSPPATPAPRARPAPRPVTIGRTELDHYLADFDAASREIRLETAPGGIRVLAIGTSTLPHRLGLRRGDLVRSVAGIPTHSLEDGADVYVKLSRIDHFDIDVTRGGDQLTLPVRIKK